MGHQNLDDLQRQRVPRNLRGARTWLSSWHGRDGDRIFMSDPAPRELDESGEMAITMFKQRKRCQLRKDQKPLPTKTPPSSFLLSCAARRIEVVPYQGVMVSTRVRLTLFQLAALRGPPFRQYLTRVYLLHAGKEHCYDNKSSQPNFVPRGESASSGALVGVSGVATLSKES